MPSRRFILIRLTLFLVLALAGPARAESAADPGRVAVFAAASLKEAMDEIAAGFEKATGHGVVVTLAGSSVLARQIQAGAPADIFVSANRDWMDVLERDGLVEPESRFDVAGNRLVLIAHGRTKHGKSNRNLTEPVDLDAGFDLVGMLNGGRLAIALTRAVPAGIYGRAALTTLGLWDGVAPHLAEVDNVRAALRLVSLGEAPLGIVYATDAAAEPRVRIIATFPAASHEPIVYPAALITGRDGGVNAAANDFLAWLQGPDARAALIRHGFTVPERK